MDDKKVPVIMHDYSVTWKEVKPLLEEELTRRGKGENDKMPIAVIKYALDKVWNNLYEKMKKEYEDN